MAIAKKYKVVIYFCSLSIVAFFIQQEIVRHVIEQRNNAYRISKIPNGPVSETDINFDFLIDLYYIALGLMIFFVVINLVSIAGLIIAKIRKDPELQRGFAITSIISITFTLLAFWIGY